MQKCPKQIVLIHLCSYMWFHPSVRKPCSGWRATCLRTCASHSWKAAPTLCGPSAHPAETTWSICYILRRNSSSLCPGPCKGMQWQHVNEYPSFLFIDPRMLLSDYWTWRLVMVVIKVQQKRESFIYISLTLNNKSLKFISVFLLLLGSQKPKSWRQGWNGIWKTSDASWERHSGWARIAPQRDGKQLTSVSISAAFVSFVSFIHGKQRRCNVFDTTC